MCLSELIRSYEKTGKNLKIMRKSIEEKIEDLGKKHGVGLEFMVFNEDIISILFVSAIDFDFLCLLSSKLCLKPHLTDNSRIIKFKFNS